MYGMYGMYGMVWYGMVWYGMVWYGMVWYGMVWYGMIWYGMVWYGMVWYGMVWYGMVWYGMYVWKRIVPMAFLESHPSTKSLSSASNLHPLLPCSKTIRRQHRDEDTRTPYYPGRCRTLSHCGSGVCIGKRYIKHSWPIQFNASLDKHKKEPCGVVGVIFGERWLKHTLRKLQISIKSAKSSFKPFSCTPG